MQFKSLVLWCVLHLSVSTVYGTNVAEQEEISPYSSTIGSTSTVLTGDETKDFQPLIAVPAGAIVLSSFPQHRSEIDTIMAAVDSNGSLIPMSSTLEEQKEFKKYRLAVMLKRMVMGLPVTLYHTIFNKNKVNCTDADLNAHLNDSPHGTLLTTDQRDRLVVDLTHFDNIPTLPNSYLHGAKIFFKDEKGVKRLDSIEIAGSTMRSSDRNWEFAKIHALTSWSLEFAFGGRGAVHMVNNFVNTMTKKVLSDTNPLRLFLNSHFSIGVPLDDFGLNAMNSSLQNPTALPLSSVAQLTRRKFVEYITKGLEPQYPNTLFNRALMEAYQVTKKHVGNFIKHNIDPKADYFQEIRTFCDAVHKVVLCYPSGEAIQDLSLLQKMIARVIFEGSFFCSADHNSLNTLGVFGVLYNLRQPFSKNAVLSINELFWHQDTFGRVLYLNAAQEVQCQHLLRDVEYDPRLNVDTKDFKKQLSNLEEKYPTIFPLDKTSSSIDL